MQRQDLSEMTRNTVGVLQARKVFETIRGFRSAPLIMIVLVIVVVMSFASPAFMTGSNIKTTALGLAADGIVVIGMTLALVSGGVDLSVGSVFMLSGVITGKMWLLGLNVWLAALCGLVGGFLCGLFVGIWVGRIGINPLITSLAMMGIARGLGYILTRGTPLSLYRMPAQFTVLGGGDILGIPIFVIIFVIVALAFMVLVKRARSFRKIFYTGSNEKAAILSGINVRAVKISVYIMSAMLPAVAGILSMARFKVATPSCGSGMELAAISAAVIGGASLQGGEGYILGSVLGILMLALIRNALVLQNVSVYWQQFVAGVILFVAITIDHISHRRRMK